MKVDKGRGISSIQLKISSQMRHNASKDDVIISIMLRNLNVSITLPFVLDEWLSFKCKEIECLLVLYFY